MRSVLQQLTSIYSLTAKAERGENFSKSSIPFQMYKKAQNNTPKEKFDRMLDNKVLMRPGTYWNIMNL
jgi:hypothetical protein